MKTLSHTRALLHKYKQEHPAIPGLKISAKCNVNCDQSDIPSPPPISQALMVIVIAGCASLRSDHCNQPRTNPSQDWSNTCMARWPGHLTGFCLFRIIGHFCLEYPVSDHDQYHAGHGNDDDQHLIHCPLILRWPHPCEASEELVTVFFSPTPPEYHNRNHYQENLNHSSLPPPSSWPPPCSSPLRSRTCCRGRREGGRSCRWTPPDNDDNDDDDWSGSL